MNDPQIAPLSWLRLERYVLGELNARERIEIEARLASSALDRERVDAILRDRVELVPLPRVSSLPSKLRRATRRRTMLWIGSAAAACALLVLRSSPSGLSPGVERPGIKGGDIALMLYGEHQGEAPSTFRGDERYKLFVTCPPGFQGRLRVLVFQGGESHRPLAAADPFACGNRVPWPGAFRLSGAEDADVCLSWADDEAQARQPSDLAGRAVCTRLSAPH